jgi:hypothetical protein
VNGARGSVGEVHGVPAPAGRTDQYLLASGVSAPALAQRFSLGQWPVYNHSRKHISDEFKKSVKVGPFASEEKLREICAENGESVLTQLKVVNQAVASRWLMALENNAHTQFLDLTIQLRKNLELMGRLTKELVPPSPVQVTNNIALFEAPEYVQAIAGIADALRPYPKARKAVAAALRALGAADEGPLIEAQPVEAEPAEVA